MISLQTDIEGKRGYFGQIEKEFKRHGFFLCGAWKYDRGKFDAKLWKENAETIYLRIPFHVLKGELDRRDAYIEFRTPYIIKHVVNIGLEWGEDSLLSVVGLSQFQKPLDKDAEINNKERWRIHGDSIINNILSQVNFDG